MNPEQEIYTAAEVQRLIDKERKGYRKQIFQLEQKIKSLEGRGKLCYICGSDQNITKHHLIWKRIKTEVNECASRGSLSIPLCAGCHVKVEKVKNVVRINLKKLSKVEEVDW
jgi:hypothetical protein